MSPQRILIADTDPGGYWSRLFETESNLRDASFSELMGARAADYVSMADFYAEHLGSSGFECLAVPLNAPEPQLAWARENKRRPLLGQRALTALPARIREFALQSVFVQQVQTFDPSVILVLNVYAIAPSVLRRLQKAGRLLVAQHAASAVSAAYVRPYDLVVTSYEPMRAFLTSLGCRVEMLPLAFESRVVDNLFVERKSDRVSFVGSFSRVHSSRQRFVESVIDLCPAIRVWAPALPSTASAGLQNAYQGPVWGLQMYRVLAESIATLNHHGIAGDYANNLRLFEATGVGTALVTDSKKNLSELFDVGVEVLSFESVNECADRLNQLLADPKLAEEIGAAGQRRTLAEHTWKRRTDDLLSILGGYT